LETQAFLDERNDLVRNNNRSPEQNKRLSRLTASLNELGFAIESREPEYALFLRSLSAEERAKRTTFTPEELQKQNDLARQIVRDLLESNEG
jgi:hypothetical protein